MSAMQVMSRCRSENMGVTVQDIIGSESISQLASLVTLPEETSYQNEDDEEFDLSPIQQVYFECMQGDQTQFNQSMLLRLRQVIRPEDVEHAINELVQAHSMFRARFSQDKNGVWRQRITQDIHGSYRFRVHQDESIQTSTENSQKCLNFVEGPVLAVDLFNFRSEESLLFITAHHLVIDVVSWHIVLQDLEDLLRQKSLKTPASISFQTWCRLQVENAQQDTAERVLPVEGVPTADFEYWGMEGRLNIHGDVVTEEIKLDADRSSNLFGACHESLQTEFIDLILATLLVSFGHVFPDRMTPPAIYNEGHGREPWDPSIDLSHTVGWFTTLSPVYLPRGFNIHEGMKFFTMAFSN